MFKTAPKRLDRVLDDQYTTGLLGRYSQILHNPGDWEFLKGVHRLAFVVPADPLRRRQQVGAAPGPEAQSRNVAIRNACREFHPHALVRCQYACPGIQTAGMCRRSKELPDP